MDEIKKGYDKQSEYRQYLRVWDYVDEKRKEKQQKKRHTQRKSRMVI